MCSICAHRGVNAIWLRVCSISMHPAVVSTRLSLGPGQALGAWELLEGNSRKRGPLEYRETGVSDLGSYSAEVLQLNLELAFAGYKIENRRVTLPSTTEKSIDLWYEQPGAADIVDGHMEVIDKGCLRYIR